MQRETFLRRHEFAHIKRTALDAGLRSLIVPGLLVEDRWLRSLPIPDVFDANHRQVCAHIRFAISTAADVGWPVPLMDRDRWYAADFNAARGRAKTIAWTGYKQAWLKTWVKKWVKTRLAGNWTFNTGVSNANRLLYFSRFLAEEAPDVNGPQDLTRQVLLDFVAWIERHPDAAGSQKQGPGQQRQSPH